MSTSAAAQMDWLSDRMGALLPWVNRLPPRHPVAVSLMMLFLASVNWLAMQLLAVAIICALTGSFLQGSPDLLILAANLLGFCLVVLTPWSAWLGARKVWSVLLTPYVFAATIMVNQVQLGLWSFLGLWNYIVSGLAVGAILALPGLFLTGRWNPVWLVVTMGASAITLVPSMRLIQWLFRFDLLFLLRGVVANDPGNLRHAWAINLGLFPYFALMSLCLGYLLWDMTPSPEPSPLTAGGAA